MLVADANASERAAGEAGETQNDERRPCMPSQQSDEPPRKARPHNSTAGERCLTNHSGTAEAGRPSCYNVVVFFFCTAVHRSAQARPNDAGNSYPFVQLAALDADAVLKRWLIYDNPSGACSCAEPFTGCRAYLNCKKPVAFAFRPVPGGSDTQAVNRYALIRDTVAKGRTRARTLLKALRETGNHH